MSIKSSSVYLTVEGASLHIYTDVTTGKVIFQLDYLDGGAYGTSLSFVLGNDKDESLMKLLQLLEQAETTDARSGVEK